MDNDWPGPRVTMNENNEFMHRDTHSPRKERMFLPLRVESSGDQAHRDSPKRTPTLSPVLLSPSSTTNKLIALGKIKNCFILLQKTRVDDSCFKALTDTGEDTADDDTVSGQTYEYSPIC